MTKPMPQRAAFTLIELLVVVAIIALLIAILIPSLNGAREQAKRAFCLANLRNMGSATQAYSSEDSNEHTVPIHVQHVLGPYRTFPLWRTTNWFAWGGVDGVKPFKITTSGQLTFNDNDPEGRKWSGRTRPLNKYVYKDLNASDALRPTIFKCPSDAGYRLHGLTDDAPKESQNTPCIQILGNSYRGSFWCWITFPDVNHVFTMSAWGHRISSLVNTSEIILFGEPNFFNMIGNDTGTLADLAPINLYGWHKKVMTDNLLYCDGSARTTQAGKTAFSRGLGAEMGISQNNASMIRRGKNWRLDTYPTPGARIKGAQPRWWLDGVLNVNEWPVAGAQDNMKDHPTPGS